MKRVSQTTTIEDLLANPKAFGLPTLQEFMKNRDKYFGRSDEDMTALSEGPVKFRKDLNKIIFKVHGVLIETEEKVEKVLGDYGFSLADIDLKNRDSKLKKTMEMVPQGGGKYDVVVNFLP